MVIAIRFKIGHLIELQHKAKERTAEHPGGGGGRVLDQYLGIGVPLRV